MTYLIYICILVILCAVFWITLKVSQNVTDKQLSIRAIKEYQPIVLTNEAFSSEQLADAHTKKVIDKIHQFNDPDAQKKSFIKELNFKISYIYELDPIKNYFILLIKILMVTLCILVFTGFFSTLWSVIIATPVTLVLSLIIVNIQYKKRLASFLDEFVYAMDIIVRGIKTGLAINECFKLIVKESKPVVAEQFIAMINDYKIGLPTDQVMQRFMARLPLKEVRFFGLSIIIQSKTGGNLAEVIANLAKILRNRKSLLLRIQTLAQQAKTSAIIMGSLPLFIIGILSFIAPDYVAELTHTTLGNMVLAGCAVWMGIGALIMRHMINFYN